jgi:hypothetical protein
LWYPVQICDISAAGVGLLMPRRFEPGTMLSLELSVGTESPPRQLLVQVRRATISPGKEWVAGCRLSFPLTEDELEALVVGTEKSHSCSDPRSRPT